MVRTATSKDPTLIANPLQQQPKPKSHQCDVPDTSNIINGPHIRHPSAHSASQELFTNPTTNTSKNHVTTKTVHVGTKRIAVSAVKRNSKTSIHKPVSTTLPCSGSDIQSKSEVKHALAVVESATQLGNRVQLSAIQEADEDKEISMDIQVPQDDDLDYVQEKDHDELFELDGIATTDEKLEGADGVGSMGRAAKVEVKAVKFGTLKKGKTNKKNIKAAIESILGVDALPEKDRSELVTHFSKDPMKRCFALVTEENWEEIMVEWAIHAVKKGKDAGIEIIIPKKSIYFEHLEEAVKENSAPAATKPKVKSKAKDINLFLPAKDNPENTSFEPDEHDLNPERTTKYHRQKNKLIEAWPCKEHPNSICMLRALNSHHKVLNFEGELVWVLALLNGTENDLKQPPEIEYFKFFYHRLGVPNAPSGVPLHRGGARFHSEPPAGAAQQMPPPLFLFSRESSPKFELELEPHANVPVPTIDQWLRELKMQGVTYTRWDILQERFKNEDLLKVLISSIARVNYDSLKSGFDLKMVDLLFVIEQLKIARGKYGFAVSIHGDWSRKTKRCRHE
ncbi:hypothetical protein K439DRAFT_1612819 [Ramaria rubella]|nr:hypothetical protein K439DRAFT_1612819 [Ramaria rubella]